MSLPRNRRHRVRVSRGGKTLVEKKIVEAFSTVYASMACELAPMRNTGGRQTDIGRLPDSSHILTWGTEALKNGDRITDLEDDRVYIVQGIVPDTRRQRQRYQVCELKRADLGPGG